MTPPSLPIRKAAILGAESFGFGTAPMVALGCKFLRICHLNNCATGVATQDARLRDKHFIGQAEMVMNYFKFVAEDTRLWLAKLGISGGYGFAWAGHFFFEKNRPATFQYPLWSLMGDWRMWFETLVGRRPF